MDKAFIIGDFSGFNVTLTEVEEYRWFEINFKRNGELVFKLDWELFDEDQILSLISDLEEWPKSVREEIIGDTGDEVKSNILIGFDDKSELCFFPNLTKSNAQFHLYFFKLDGLQRKRFLGRLALGLRIFFNIRDAENLNDFAGEWQNFANRD